MSLPVLSVPIKHSILIVDDEPDIYKVTALSLKGICYAGREIEFLAANSGEEAIQVMRANPAIAVILLDVVMETQHAGLDVCRVIRKDLRNRFVRILLRTGQPGAAPEKQTIDDYDIDGYLSKAELSSIRLYGAVRTALKAWEELIELERHRVLLGAIHDCVVSLHSYEPLEDTLGRILETAITLCPTPLAVLRLETFEQAGNPRTCLLHLATDPDPDHAKAAAVQVANRIAHDANAQSLHLPAPIDQGFLVPFALHHELGYGWIYLEGVSPDETVARALTLLGAHAANALYSTVAQTVLTDREGPIYETMIV